MKIKIYIFVIAIGISYGCNSVKQENQIVKESQFEKNPEGVSENISHQNFDSTLLFIDLLDKFYNQDDYFVPLYFIDKYSEQAVKELENTNAEIIYRDDENQRTKLDESTVKKHLLVNNLDRLIVVNNNQEVIDTLSRKNYEYYEANIESVFIATYSSGSKLKDNVVISMNGLNSASLKKSPEFNSDTIHTQKLIEKNSFKPDVIYSSAHMKYGKDTITFLSFGNYKNGKECLYLLRNGVPVDSVINDFIISTMTPVPLATDSELIYISTVHVPETDIQWTSLTGIDLVNYKFKFYDRNRKKIN